MSHRYYYGLTMIAMLLIMVSIIIMPKSNEIALMELQDGHLKKAFRSYAELIEKGDDSINVVIPLSQLYLQYGEVLKGLELVEGFVKSYPKSMDARKRLGKFYEYAQMPYAYQTNLETMVAQQPSAELLRELEASYGFHRQYDKQMDTLDALIHNKNYHFREEDYLKLAQLYATRKRTDEALAILVLLQSLKGNEISMMAANLTLSLLLGTGKISEAETFARLYIADNHDTASAVSFASQFREQGHAEMAIHLLTPFLQNDETNAELLGEFVSASIDKGKDKDMVTYLLKQMEAGNIPDTVPETLVAYGLQKEDVTLLDSLPGRLPLSSLPEYLLIRYVEFAFLQHKPQLAKEIRNNLSPSFLRNTPFISALITLAENPSDHVVAHFTDVQKAMTLTATEKLAAITIYNKLNKKEQAFALLRTIPVSAMLENIDLVAVADYYLSLGGADECIRIFEQERVHTTQAYHRDIIHVLLLVTAGSGNIEKFTKFAAEPLVTAGILDDSYSIASKYQHTKLATVAASLLLKQEPTGPHRLQLADAYIDNKQYPEALQLVKDMIKSNKRAQSIYLNAISSLIAMNGAPAVQPYLGELNGLINDLVEHPDILPEEKREFAYLLINAHLHERAQTIFLDLAKDAPADTPDVEQLLDLWGDHPDKVALEWINMRTIQAKGLEKKKWLAHVRNKAGSRGVIEVVKADKGEKSPEVMDMYLDAVMDSKNVKDLEEFITDQIARHHEDVVRLKKFTIIAYDKAMMGIAETGLRKLVQITPEDMEVTKLLGLLLYSKGSYKEAEGFIEAYVAEEEGDYQINYAYAQLLWRKKMNDEAVIYADKALLQLSTEGIKDMNAHMMEANLLYRKGDITHALELFRDLLAQYPDNKALRAEFGNILIENKLFTEATTVLKEPTHEN